MAAVITAAPSTVPASGFTSVSGTGGGAYKNRLKLDGTVVWTGCAETFFDGAAVQVGTAAGTETLDWEQYIASVWTSVDTQTITVTTASSSPSSPMTITTNSQTVSDKSFTATTFWSGFGIYAHGGDGTSPITNLIIRRCTFTGFEIAISLAYVSTYTIEDCVINDTLYAGILVFSGLNGTIQRNTIQRVGYQNTPPMEVNAYGIALTRVGDANFTTHPRSASTLVDSNTITDVPSWEGIDTHAGSALTFTNNVLRRNLHGAVLGPDGAGNQAQNITFDSNQVLEAKGRQYGLAAQANIAAITINDLHPSSEIKTNQISTTYPTATVGRVYDYLGLSSSIYGSITGNTDVA
jgi:parallel beta-helix repeat protein